jgi:putative membrane protein
MTETTEAPRTRPVLAPLHAVRGFLIGMAELVPGVSGGTVALVTGVYDRLIDSASHVLGAGRRLLRGPDRRRGAAAEVRRTDWLLVGPVLLGMAIAVVTMAGVLEGFVTGSPELARGLFFGLVAASVLVPIRMLPEREEGSRGRDVALVLVALVAAFVLTSLAGGFEVTDPPYVLVALAAAVAVCALVVPGVSGSFFLLAVGLYTPTLTAVHDRDLVYIAVFTVGAVVGLATFVQVLHYLLHTRRRGTLLVMVGLMVGSLRALWPWQGEAADVDGEAVGTGALSLPYDPWLGPVLLMVLGVVIVLGLYALEQYLPAHKTGGSGGDAP